MKKETLERANQISKEIGQLDELIGHFTIHKVLPIAVTVKVVTFLPLMIGASVGKIPKTNGDEPELLLPKAIADKLLPMCIERRDDLKKELENL